MEWIGYQGWTRQHFFALDGAKDKLFGVRPGIDKSFGAGQRSNPPRAGHFRLRRWFWIICLSYRLKYFSKSLPTAIIGHFWKHDPARSVFMLYNPNADFFFFSSYFKKYCSGVFDHKRFWWRGTFALYDFSIFLGWAELFFWDRAGQCLKFSGEIPLLGHLRC